MKLLNVQPFAHPQPRNFLEPVLDHRRIVACLFHRWATHFKQSSLTVSLCGCCILQKLACRLRDVVCVKILSTILPFAVIPSSSPAVAKG